MPPLSRRALLATVATGVVGSVAGCQTLTNDRPAVGPPAVTGLSETALYVDDRVTFPETAGVTTVDDSTDADLAVFPPRDASVEPAAETLAADVPVAVAGTDAQRTLMDVCDATDQPYGIARDSWTAATSVAGAVPAFEVLDTHLFVGMKLPRDLPWALGELLQSTVSDCDVPIEHVPVDDAISLGTARVRGYNAVGEFDRRDRVAAVRESTPTPVFVDTEATIVAGRRGGETGPYRADRVELIAQFDQRFDDVGPAAQTNESLSVRNVSDGTENVANVVFTPRSTSTRDSFTACQRARVVVDDFDGPFSYTGDARFRWADPQQLDDETWVQHTPGRAIWHPRYSSH